MKIKMILKNLKEKENQKMNKKQKRILIFRYSFFNGIDFTIYYKIQFILCYKNEKNNKLIMHYFMNDISLVF